LNLKRFRFSPDGIAVTVLVLVWLLFFWRLFTPVDADRKMLIQGDFSGQFVAFGAYQYERFAAGEIPLWNPYNNGGLPFLADTQAAVFYPSRLVTIGLSKLAGGWSYNALQMEMCFHLLAYTLLMYAFIRRMTLDAPASIFGAFAAAVIAGYGGFMSGYPPLQLALLEAAIWLPLALIGIIEATREKQTRWLWLILTGFALGLSWMAGHPQTSWFITYLLVAYFAYRIYMQGINWRVWIIGTALFGSITVGLAAVQLIPGAEYLTRTARVGLNFDDKGNGFPFQDVAQFLFPGVVSLWSPLYVGIVGLALAGIALIGKVKERYFWLITALIALGLSFGANSVIFHALYNILPGLSFFRGQERAAYLVSVSLAILAGLGAAYLPEIYAKYTKLLWRFLLSLAGLCAVIAGLIFVVWLGNRDLYSSVIGAAAFSTMIAVLIITIFAQFMPSRTGLLLLAGLIVFDLFSVNIDNSNFQPNIPDPLAASPQVAQLQADHDIPFRIDGDNSGLPGNAGSLYQLQDMRGISPLFLDSAHAIVERELPSEHDWELFAVRYVFSRADSLPSPSEIIGSENDPQGTLYLHRLTDPRPFALLIYDFDVVDSDAFARALLADPAYNPRDSIILNRAPDIILPNSPAETAEARVTLFAPEHFTVEVNTSENALLSLAQLDYPGWKAAVDGQPANILRAYGAFTALEVPSGQHTITFSYGPISYKLGAVLSLFTWTTVFILGAMALFGRILRR